MPLQIHPVGGPSPACSIKGLLLSLVVFFGLLSTWMVGKHLNEATRINVAKIDNAEKPLENPRTRVPPSAQSRFPLCEDPCSSAVCKNLKRSTIRSQCCEEQGFIPKPPRVYPLILSATPRSGTTGAVKFLRKLGLRLSHDFSDPWKDGMVSWIHIFSEFDHIANQSNTQAYPYYGYGKLNSSRFAEGLHLVREPLTSITSLSCAVLQNTHVVRANSSMSGSFRQFVERHTGIDANATDVNLFRSGMRMWLEWHRFMDSLCLDLIRTEDLFDPSTTLDILAHIFDLLGKPLPSGTRIGKALGQTGKKTNTRKHRKTIRWKDLFALDPDLAFQVHELASAYGYTFDVDAQKLWHLSKSDPVPAEFWPRC